MSGNRTGGLRSAAKLKAQDPDYYRKLGKKTHKAWIANGKKPRGFSYDRELASKAGAKGGRISRRGKK